MHDVFHVHDKTHVISYDNLDVQDDISIDDRPIKVLKRKQIIPRNRTISLVKVLWTRHSEKETTWEHDGSVRKPKYDLSFEIYRTKFVKGGRM